MALTARQREVWDLRRPVSEGGQGKSGKEAAAILGISVQKVHNTMGVVHKKLGIKDAVRREYEARSIDVKQTEKAATLLDKATDPFAEIKKAIRESGLPDSTGRAFLRRLAVRYGSVPQVVREFKTRDLLRKLDERIELALEYMDEKVVAEASFRDLSLGTSALIEKRQLLRGEPTQIIADADRKKLNELLPALIAEGHRRGITIEGTALRVVNSEVTS